MTEATPQAPPLHSDAYPLQPPSFTQPEPPPLRRAPRVSRRMALFALLFAVGAAAGSSVAAGVILSRQSSSNAAATVVPPAITTPKGGPFSGSGDGNGAGNGSTTPQSPPSSSPGSPSASSIAAAVDPAVVDINGTLAGGGEVAGTGIVITSSGAVLTNNHVIEGTTKLSGQIDGAGTTFTVTVLGTDATDDVALVKLDGASGLKTVTLGDSSEVNVGDHVVAIGNALGRGGTPASTEGSVTALDQTITAGDSTADSETLNGTIQINAYIQPGDSGGPLVDAQGHTIGIDTAAQSSGRFQSSGSNIAFAIPINTAMNIVRQIEAGRSSSTVQIGQRGILGVEIASDQSGSNAAVSAVESRSPAQRAGIASGDVITSINGHSVSDAKTLQAALAGKHPGDSVTVGWTDQSGANHSATVQLEAGPPA
ncbi:MAG: S1C family serine protease [Candidatus Dormibacteria bacterium]